MTATIDEGTVRVLLFSVLRERLGRREVKIELEEAVTVSDFERRLFEAIPELEEFKSSLRVAVNEEYADGNMMVGPGDEVALITPTSGG